MKSGCGVDKKVLIAMLLLLLIVVIGLGVAITVVILNNNDDSSVADCFQDGVDMWECVDEKVWSYIEVEEYDDGEEVVRGCEEALEVYDKIPVDRVDKQTLVTLYGKAYSLSSYCRDEESEEYWRSKYRESSKQIERRNV